MALGLWTWIGVGSHYYFAFVSAAQCAWLWMAASGRQRWLDSAKFVAVAGLAGAIWAIEIAPGKWRYNYRTDWGAPGPRLPADTIDRLDLPLTQDAEGFHRQAAPA